MIEQELRCKLFLCEDHGFDYLPFETDEDDIITCPICGRPMSFDCVLP